MADLIKRLTEEGHFFNFFQALSLLEEHYLKNEGNSNPLESGKIKLEPDSSLGFPPNDIVSISEEDGMLRFVLSFMGLVGVSSPLPIYFSEYLTKHKENAGPLRDFILMFNQRIYTLFYKAWKKYCFLRTFSTEGTDPFTQKVAALAGFDITSAIPAEKLRLLAYTGIFAGRNRGKAGLQSFLSDYFGNIPVEIETWSPRWASIDNPAKIGQTMQLGINSIAGTSIYDIAGKFRVKIGPLPRDIYETFLPDIPNISDVKELVQSYMADPLDYDIEIKLQSSDLVPVVLGNDDAMLGNTSSLGNSSGKSDIQSIIIGS